MANKLADGLVSLKALEREAKQGRSRAAPKAKPATDVVFKTD